MDTKNIIKNFLHNKLQYGQNGQGNKNIDNYNIIYSNPRNIMYLCFLTGNNGVGNGIYPAIYIYQQIKKIFIVYGHSRNQQHGYDWDEISEKYCKANCIVELITPDESRQIIQNNPRYNYLDNKAISLYKYDDLQNISDELISQISEEIDELLYDYSIYFSTPPPPEVDEKDYTKEQKAIIKCKDSKIKINAYAGSGKTYTLTAYARKRKEENADTKILYLTFNRKMALEANKKMRGLAESRTAHSFAYNKVIPGTRYELKRDGGNDYYPNEIANIFKIEEDNRMSLADFILKGFRFYCNNTDDTFTQEHLESIKNIPNEIKNEEKKLICDSVNSLYSKMDKGEIECNHDFYLKKMQLDYKKNKQQIEGYNVILFDEVQDASPVMLELVSNANAKIKVFVGDTHQQIYEWRYAINALECELLKDATSFQLTESFRLQEQHAKEATKIIQLKNPKNPPLVGHHQDITNAAFEMPYTYIARTNGSLFKYAQENLNNNQTKFFFVGGFEEKFKKLLDIKHLYDNNRNAIIDPLIRYFNNFNTLTNYATNVDDREILCFCGIVEELNQDMTAVFNSIKVKTVDIENKANIIFTTAHKAKGLEWDNVKLADDYIDINEINLKIKNHNAKIEDFYPELNLLYVAKTRVKRCLQ